MFTEQADVWLTVEGDCQIVLFNVTVSPQVVVVSGKLGKCKYLMISLVGLCNQ